MFLGEPPRSQYDLHFQLLGIPIRIHPLFWVITLLLGLGISGQDTPPVEVLLWMVAVTISIVIHELGHAFMQRYFGGRPRVVLYSLGGLAICEDCDRDTRSQILIALAGPFAGFAFAMLLMALLVVTGHGIGIGVGNSPPLSMGIIENAIGFKVLGISLGWEQLANPLANVMVTNFLWINILWGIVNLLPVYPLDGGQVSRELCQIGNPRGGIILSLQISVGVAIAMAIFGFVVWNSLYTALMFGFLAYSSFQVLQAYRQQLW